MKVYVKKRYWTNFHLYPKQATNIGGDYVRSDFLWLSEAAKNFGILPGTSSNEIMARPGSLPHFQPW
jgi:hypothetical protein